jgi:hypothetical protein
MYPLPLDTYIHVSVPPYQSQMRDTDNRNSDNNIVNTSATIDQYL